MGFRKRWCVMSRVALGERCPERGCPGSPQVRDAATQLRRGQDVDTRCSERGCPSRRLRMTYTHGRCAPHAIRSLSPVRGVEHLDVNDSPLDTPPEGALQAVGVCCWQSAYTRRCVLSWHLFSALVFLFAFLREQQAPIPRIVFCIGPCHVVACARVAT